MVHQLVTFLHHLHQNGNERQTISRTLWMLHLQLSYLPRFQTYHVHTQHSDFQLLLWEQLGDHFLLIVPSTHASIMVTVRGGICTHLCHELVMSICLSSCEFEVEMWALDSWGERSKVQAWVVLYWAKILVLCCIAAELVMSSNQRIQLADALYPLESWFVISLHSL